MKINQQKVEKAFSVLDELRTTSYPNGFPKEMKGDVSSFGASIIQAGILPSVLFFSEGDHARQANQRAEEEDTKVRRAKLMKVIFDVLEMPTPAKEYAARPLLHYVRLSLSSAAGSIAALDNITEAALAVKVALRAFKFVEKPTTETQTDMP